MASINLQEADRAFAAEEFDLAHHVLFFIAHLTSVINYYHRFCIEI